MAHEKKNFVENIAAISEVVKVASFQSLRKREKWVELRNEIQRISESVENLDFEEENKHLEDVTNLIETSVSFVNELGNDCSSDMMFAQVIGIMLLGLIRQLEITICSETSGL